jgi:hypothetical protein
MSVYQLCLGEEMVRPQIRRKADSGITNRHTCRAMTAMGAPYKQLRRKMEEDKVEGVLFVQQLRTEEQTGMLPVLRKGMQEPLCQDNSS